MGWVCWLFEPPPFWGENAHFNDVKKTTNVVKSFWNFFLRDIGNGPSKEKTGSHFSKNASYSFCKLAFFQKPLVLHCETS